MPNRKPESNSPPRYLFEVEQEGAGPIDVGELGGEVGRVVLERWSAAATAENGVAELDLEGCSCE